MKNLICIFFLIFSTSILHSQELSVEKIWKNYEFFAKGVDGFRSMKDGEYYTQVIEGSIYKFKINDPNDMGALLIDNSKLKHKEAAIEFDDYFFNDDETKILFTTKTEPIYRRSFSAIYFVYDIATGVFAPLDSEHQPQTLAEYSPDGTMVSYIYKNDLFVKQLKSGKVTKLTKGGKKNKVIYGTTDWVYEEEFAITKGYEWSMDSKMIAYLRFDEQEVKEFNLTYYNGLYPEQYKYKYPKAGEDNSKVTAHVVQVKSGKVTDLNLGEYEYIPRLSWSKTANQLILQTLNRHQSSLKYHLVDFSKKPTNRVFFEEKSDTYIDVDNNLLILKDGKSILRTSEADGFNHIYRLNFDGTTQQITKGNWDVIEFLGIDDENKTIYYSSAENAPIYKSIYKIQIDGSNKQILSPDKGYSEAEFTSGMKYFVLTH
jgi:dipeptidyl-peptidase-4